LTTNPSSYDEAHTPPANSTTSPPLGGPCVEITCTRFPVDASMRICRCDVLPVSRTQTRSADARSDTAGSTVAGCTRRTRSERGSTWALPFVKPTHTLSAADTAIACGSPSNGR
jgi:hypothetical protein